MQIRGQENPWRRGFLEPQPVKCVPQLLTMDTSDCTSHCNQTSSPASQSNERKAAPREIKKPLAAVPPPAIYVLSKNSPHSLNIQVELTSLTSLASVSMSALLDSRATGMFINWSFVQKHQLETTPLPQPILIRNVDGSPNENGSVMEEVHVTLHFGCHSERAHLAVTNLGQQMVIIGQSWLTLHNPEVDWVSQKVSMTRCPPSCNGHVLPKSDPPPRKSTPPPPFGQEDAVYAILLTPEWEEHICAMSTPSQRLAEEAQAQRVCLPKSTIPEHYKDFTDIFSKEAFAHLPPCKAWDHAIELHPDAKLPRGRTFPLSPTEQKELDAFLRENLANGQIHPLKSPIGAPVFFVKKKEGSLHLVQDYWKLNKIMIKNSYPLPLVSDVLTRLHDTEWFTTLDLCWGFNNIHLKEGDKWKAAFSMNRGLF